MEKVNTDTGDVSGGVNKRTEEEKNGSGVYLKIDGIICIYQ